MSDVIIDNMSLSEGLTYNIYDLLEGEENVIKSTTVGIRNYFFSKILWDNVYHVSDRNSINVDIPREFYEAQNRCLIEYDYEIENIVQEILSQYYREEWNRYDRDIIEDSLYYVLLSQRERKNLLLTDERAIFVEQLGIRQEREFWMLTDRIRLLDKVDEGVKQFYEEVNSKWGGNSFSLKFPLLLDYIYGRVSTLEEAEEVAEELRNAPEVVQFREAMDKFDSALECYNAKEVNNILDSISVVVDEITKRGTKMKEINSDIVLGKEIQFILHKSFRFTTQYKRPYAQFLIRLSKYGMEGRDLLK